MAVKREYAEQLVDAIIEAAILKAVSTYFVAKDDSVQLRYNAARETAIDLLTTGDTE